jgi:hypothetical protein
LVSNSKTISSTSVDTCLGIVFRIEIGVIQIPWTKLQEIISLSGQCLIAGQWPEGGDKVA